MRPRFRNAVLVSIAAVALLAPVVAEAKPPPQANNRACHPAKFCPSPSPSPTVTPSPTPKPTVTPSPSPTVTPSPTPAPSGWTLAFSDDFNTWDPSRYFQYPATWPDTREQQSAGSGSFYGATLSASGGLLDIPITYRKVAAFVPGPSLNLASMRYEFRIRADAMAGYKGVPLLWPLSETWPRDGEINWPEGNFTGTISGYLHHQGATSGSDQEAFPAPSGTNWQTWHTYTLEWVAGVSAEFFIDGVSIGKSTTRVPNTPMHLVMQFESALDGGARDPSVSGHVQLDYLRVWSAGGPTPTPTPNPTVVPTPTPTVTPTPTLTGTPVPTPTPTGSPGTTVIAAVGDIHGEGSDADSVATANMIDSINPSAILGLGDYQYTTGTCTNFTTSGHYNSDWGREQARMYDTLGPTHDYDGTTAGSNAAGYFSGQCAGQSAKSAGALLLGGTQVWSQPYSFNVGGWHIIQLPSLCYRYTGCDAAAISTWLTNDLNADTHTCQLAYWHEPYWTSPTSEHTRDTDLRAWTQILYDHGADLILNGHQHYYERFFPQNMSDVRDDARGITEIISGTGGISHYTKTSTAANEAAYNDATYGVLKLTLSSTGYATQFMPVEGGTFADASSGTCH